MKFTVFALLIFICSGVQKLRADNYQNEFIQVEEDFIQFHRLKQQKQIEYQNGLNKFLEKKEMLENQKREAVHEYLSKIRNDRAPASIAFEDDYYKKEDLRIEIENARDVYLAQVQKKQEAKNQVLSRYSSKEVRIRENKPWR